MASSRLLPILTTFVKTTAASRLEMPTSFPSGLKVKYVSQSFSLYIEAVVRHIVYPAVLYCISSIGWQRNLVIVRHFDFQIQFSGLTEHLNRCDSKGKVVEMNFIRHLA